MGIDDIGLPDHPLRAAAEADMRRVVDLIESLTGLTSKWQGVVVVRGPGFPYAGQKNRGCWIDVHEDVLLLPAQRWTTLIHEALHSVSGGFSPTRLDATQRSWEEGIVEQTQRLLRDQILAALDIALDSAALILLDQVHGYNDDIRRLEAIRVIANRPSASFYLELLRATSIQRALRIARIVRTSTGPLEEAP